MRKNCFIHKGVATKVLLAGVFISSLSVEALTLGGDGSVIVCPYLPGHLSEVPLCDGKQVTCVGTDGPDVIWGTDGADVIHAGAGNDVVQGDAGDDTICAGDGDDAIHGARGNDTIFGGDGDDWVFGAVDDDTLSGGNGDYDVLWGGPGFDKIDAGAGDFDVCLGQREGAEYNQESCEAIYPPVGYKHDEEHDMGTGIIGPRSGMH
ncbi:MAG: calcium-binding protein [Pseudomonadota bacterium]